MASFSLAALIQKLITSKRGNRHWLALAIFRHSLFIVRALFLLLFSLFYSSLFHSILKPLIRFWLLAWKQKGCIWGKKNNYSQNDNYRFSDSGNISFIPFRKS